MSKFNTRETANYSEHSETYVIIGDPSASRVKAWESALYQRFISSKPLLGRYGNVNEQCLIFNAKDFGWGSFGGGGAWRLMLDGQESVLVLGPMASATDHRPATLHYLDGRLPEFLGYFVPLDDDECTPQALAKLDAYTYDPSTDTYYVCRK